MAIVSLGTVGSAQLKTAGTSIAMTTGVARAAGSFVLVAVGKDPAAASTAADRFEVTGIVDSAGNTYHYIEDQSNATSTTAGLHVSLWGAVIANALTTTTTVTATLSTSVTAKTISGWAWSLAGGSTIGVNGLAGSAATTSNTALNAAATNATAASAGLVVRVQATENTVLTQSATGYTTMSAIATAGNPAAGNVAFTGWFLINQQAAATSYGPTMGGTSVTAPTAIVTGLFREFVPSVTLAALSGTLSVSPSAASGTVVGTPTGISSGSNFRLTSASSSNFAINASTGQITTTTANIAAGSYSVTIAEQNNSAGVNARYTTLNITSAVPAPTITTSTTATVAENSTLAVALTGTNVTSWSIVGGADQGRFDVSGTTLRWLANTTKDFETPDDSDLNNTYVVTVRATNSSGTADQTITVTVTDVAGPTITSTNTATVVENAVLAKTVTADVASTWSFTVAGGADYLQFETSTLGPSTSTVLRWASNGTRNFESPQDANADNVYVVMVRATNSEGFSEQAISVTVTDVAGPVFTSTAAKTVQENSTLAAPVSTDISSTWSIVGGEDSAKFQLSTAGPATATTLQFAGGATKNFEAPDDANADNVFAVTVRATSAANPTETTDQNITVTVANDTEARPPYLYDFTPLAVGSPITSNTMWARAYGTAGIDLITNASGQLAFSGTTAASFVAYVEQAPTTTDSFVEMTAILPEITSDFSLYTLCDNIITQYYRLGVAAPSLSSMRYTLYRKTAAGTSTILIAATTVTMPAGGTWGLRSRIVGSDVVSEVYINTSLRATYTDVGGAESIPSGLRGIEAYRDVASATPRFEQVRTNYVASSGSTLPANAGGFTMAGTNATMLIGRRLVANPGVVSQTGTNAALKVGRKIVAAPATFSVTGASSTLLVGRKITANPTTFSTTGTATALKVGRKIVANPSSYSLTGTPADIYSAKKIIMTPGVYTQSGTAANLLAARKLTANPSSYSVTGTAAILRRGYLVAASAGSYALSGSAIAQTVGRKTFANSGSFAVVGTNTINQNRAIRIAAGSGDLYRYWRLRAPRTYLNGFFAITELELRSSANGADLTTGKTAIASTSTGYPASNAIDDSTGTFFTDVGTPPPAGGHWIYIDLVTPSAVAQVSLQVRTDSFREDPLDLILEGSSNAVNWTVQSSFTDIPAWTAGETRLFNSYNAGAVYTYTGTATNAHLFARKTTLAPGSYVRTGVDATLRKGYKITANPVTYATTGTSASLAKSWKIAVQSGSYAVTGTNTTRQIRALLLTTTAGVYSFSGTDPSRVGLATKPTLNLTI